MCWLLVVPCPGLGPRRSPNFFKEQGSGVYQAGENDRIQQDTAYIAALVMRSGFRQTENSFQLIVECVQTNRKSLRCSLQLLLDREKQMGTCL